MHVILQVLYTLCKLPHQGLCTCCCLFHLKCSWWKYSCSSLASFFRSWLKDHIFRRALSGHPTANIIIFFFTFLFYFSSSHCFLFFFYSTEVILHIFSLIAHLEEYSINTCWMNDFLNHQVISPSTLQVEGKDNLFLRSFRAICWICS